MRLFAVIVVSALLGLGIGATTAYVEARSGSQAIVVPKGDAPLDVSADSRASRVEVDDPTFDFGSMQRGTTKSHQFVFKNVGTAPLTLRVGQTSCKCTLGTVDDEPIPPGESVEVELEWSAKQDGGEFRQTATILTNDPTQSQVLLTVFGTIVQATGVSPPDLVFDKVPAGGVKTAEVYLMAMLQDELHVGSAMLTDEKTRDLFDIQIEPVAKEALPDPKAKAGVKISVTSKPGLPVGRFDQWLSLTTDLADAKKLDIPVVGRVVGDISLYGRDWSEERATLSLGRVKSSTGKKSTINIVVRGEQAGEVEFSFVSANPPELNVEIGEAKKLKDDLVHVPLTVEIPPGTRPMAFLDTAQGDEGRIVIGTTHPTIKELVVGVRFAVER